MNLDINQWLDTDLGRDIWTKKYQYNNETFEEWLERVSGGNKNIAQLIRDKKFLFGGRILASRGLQNQGRKITLSNCYVITPPDDNIESIFDCAKKLARTYSYGGGCGIDISKLSPRGSRINNAARETSGACSFMDLYDITTKLIGQNGRRGALMISLDCSHPDIEEFIGLKSDLDKVTKANISIKITDDFMKAVKNDTDWELTYTRPETGEVISKLVRAKDLFRKMAYMNWDYAEPGLLSWNRIKDWNLLSEDDNFEYAGVNPCFTGDMKLLTDKGYKTFEELNNQNVNVVNINGEITNGKVWCSGEKETVKITLANKKVITCTPDHRFMTSDGEECLAKDLKGKKIMPKLCYEKTFNEKFIKLGFIQGDGQLNRLKSEDHKGLEVNIGYKDGDIKYLFEDDEYTQNSDNRTIYLQGYNEKLKELEFCQEILPNRILPLTYYSWNKLDKASFLQGCYSANGSIIKNHRISYKTTCKDFADQLKKALLEFNIDSNITTNKPKKVSFNNGDYVCKESYDVNINKYEDIQTFHQEIGFYQQYKKIQLQTLLTVRNPIVTSVKPNGKHLVYDFNEPKTHWGIVEGFVAHNCAEEPLPAGGSCLLGSINLSEFVKNPFTKQASFDYDEYVEAVKQGVIALNEVLHEGLPLHPLQEQRDSVNNWRQIGLGNFGWHDALIKLGIKYGSKDSLNLADEISNLMINYAVQASADLTDVYGKYPMYNEQAIFNSDFFKTNICKPIQQLVKEKGLANSQLLTIPPTGSTATMLGVSTALEPIYNISYTRKTESLHGKDEYYKVYTPIVEQYMKANNITKEEDLPEFINTAMTLNYKKRIDMQSAWQSNIDASISSTVNVNKDFTIEETEDLYMYAWEKGLKGVTLFRDGCKRVGVLTNEPKQEEVVKTEKEELTRGYILDVSDDLIGKKRKLMTGCGSLHVLAYFDPTTGDLLETYLAKGSTGGCNNFMIGLSRMLSLSARAGMNIKTIVDQLNSSGVCPSYSVRKATKGDTSKGGCCPTAIGFALLEMHKEVLDDLGIEVEEVKISDTVKYVVANKEKVKCPTCKTELQFQGGCNSCPNCGFSKCE